MQRRLAAVVLGLGLFVVLSDVAHARIKLITLPVRERVEIQLDNPNATLVEEERIVPLVKGVNQVDFSWANTQIDPNTIVFRVIPKAEPAAEREGAGQAFGRESPLRQLSAQRGGPRLASRLQRLRLCSGTDQLPLGQSQQELRLPGGSFQRREDADAFRVHPHPELG